MSLTIARSLPQLVLRHLTMAAPPKFPTVAIEDFLSLIVGLRISSPIIPKEEPVELESKNQSMGNSFGGRRRKTVKIMKIDGSSFRLKPPVSAGEVLSDHPGHSLLHADEVKSLGVRARPLAAGDPLLPGHLYFLVLLPRLSVQENPRRAYSGNLRVTAKERLESLALSRRTVSDLASHSRPPADDAEPPGKGGTRLRVRLPKAEVARLVEESRDSDEAVQKIMELAASAESMQKPSTPVAARKEKRTRFMQIPQQVN